MIKSLRLPLHLYFIRHGETEWSLLGQPPPQDRQRRRSPLGWLCAMMIAAALAMMAKRNTSLG